MLLNTDTWQTLKNKNKQTKLLPKSWKRETKVYSNPGLS